MRVVIDTNVLVSAAIKATSLPSIAVSRAGQSSTLLKSIVTEAELLAVIDRPYLARLIAPSARDRLMQIIDAAELVPITERVVASRDAKDDKFLELAVNGRADLIVSGDEDLLVLNPFRNIPILTPAAYVQRAWSGEKR